MTQKDLAEEYLDRKVKQAPFKSLTTDFEFAFSANDIKAAFNAGRESVLDDIPVFFNAGRESVVDDIPDLKWECEYPHTADEARTPITIFHIFHNDDSFHLTGYGLGLSKMFGTLYEAKRFANEHYKKQIKQALGL